MYSLWISLSDKNRSNIVCFIEYLFITKYMFNIQLDKYLNQILNPPKHYSKTLPKSLNILMYVQNFSVKIKSTQPSKEWSHTYWIFI